MEPTSHNGIIAFIGGTPAWLAVLIDTNTVTVISAIALPCLFFALGKAIDIVYREYVRRLEK